MVDELRDHEKIVGQLRIRAQLGGITIGNVCTSSLGIRDRRKNILILLSVPLEIRKLLIRDGGRSARVVNDVRKRVCSTCRPSCARVEVYELTGTAFRKTRSSHGVVRPNEIGKTVAVDIDKTHTAVVTIPP